VRFLAAQLDARDVVVCQCVAADLGGLVLDPHYEAKCLAHLCEGDLLWTIGCRARATLDLPSLPECGTI
jgi:hypothetical protein